MPLQLKNFQLLKRAIEERRFAFLVVLGCVLIVVTVIVITDFSSNPIPDESTDADPVIAIVGSRKILQSEVESEIQRRLDLKRPVRDSATVVDEMVFREAQLQQALASGLADDPEVRRSYENLLIGKLRQRELPGGFDSVTVSDEEVQAAVAEASTAEQPAPVASRRLAVIVQEKALRFNPKMGRQISDPAQDSRVRKLLGSVREQAIELPPNAGFGVLAIRHSRHQQSRYQGGDIGWIKTGADLPQIERAAIAAGFSIPEAGEISEIVETDKAFYLVRLTSKKGEPSLATTSAANEREMRRSLTSTKLKQLRASYELTIRNASGVTIYQDRLGKIRLPQEAGTRKPSSGFSSITLESPPTMTKKKRDVR